MSGEMSWDEFQQCSFELLKKSDKLNDNWEWVETGREVGASYLVKRVKMLRKNEDTSFTHDLDNFELDFPEFNDPAEHALGRNEGILFYEFHLIYSISYCVPILYFTIHNSDGTQVQLDDAWKLFNKAYVNEQNEDMYQVLTQMEHPILYKPFLALHPCKTAEMLANLPHSKNKIITFLSTYGPAVNLNLGLDYGREEAETTEYWNLH